MPIAIRITHEQDGQTKKPADITLSCYGPFEDRATAKFLLIRKNWTRVSDGDPSEWTVILDKERRLFARIQEAPTGVHFEWASMGNLPQGKILKD